MGTKAPAMITINGHLYKRADGPSPDDAETMGKETTAVADALDYTHKSLDRLNRAFNQTQPQPHYAPYVKATHVPDLLRLAEGLQGNAQAIIDALKKIR